MDEILNDEKKREEVIKMCLDSDYGNGRSIILFASPQAISGNEFWRKAIVDEVHLFCSFGMSFRSEIHGLKESLFDKIL